MIIVYICSLQSHYLITCHKYTNFGAVVNSFNKLMGCGLDDKGTINRTGNWDLCSLHEMHMFQLQNNKRISIKFYIGSLH
jgi:hypothetical protein